VSKAILNTLLVGIPEETVWVIFTLMMLGRFDIIDIHRFKENFKWLLIPIIPTTIYLNLCIYVFQTPRPIKALGALIIGVFLVKYIINRNPIKDENKKHMTIKVIIFSFLGVIALTITESVYQLVFMFIVDKDINFINNNISYNFSMSIPSRILQLLIIYSVYQNEKYHLSIKQINDVFKSKSILIATLIFVIFVILSLLFVMIMLINYNILNHISLVSQAIIAILLSLIPTVLLFCLFIVIMTSYNKFKNIQQAYDNVFKD
jgi:hypothetical protein